MKALLDTHTFLWWNLDDPSLSRTARDFIADGANQIFFSAVSAWEIALKSARGKLILPQAPGEYVASRLGSQHFQALPIMVSHALRVAELPELHRDPFDRLLVAQAQLEDLPILTADEDIRRYEVKVIW